jgi:predicted nuclease of predicted toxin-antitoxin system
LARILIGEVIPLRRDARKVKFLFDECLHMSLIIVAEKNGHEARHVNWLGLSGHADWMLMRRVVDEDFTFVTNNARDFQRLYARTPLHAGLIILVPQVTPPQQRNLFLALLEYLDTVDLINEVVEIRLIDGNVTFDRYTFPAPEA